MKAADALTVGEVLAVDPGIRGSGVAVFRGDRLHWAAYVPNEVAGNDAIAASRMAYYISRAALAVSQSIHVVCFEMPVVRDARHSKGDPNDLLPLAAIDGALCFIFGSVRLVQYKPEEWKGQVEKLAMNRRIVERLSDAERATIVNAGALTHNVHDAIGIGLHYLGRLKPTRAYARG